MSSSGERSSGFAGRREGQKSNFTVTCNLLSRYLKEKGSLGDLGLDIARSFNSRGNSRPQTPRSMDLLSATNLNAEKPLGISNPAPSPELNATRRSDAPVPQRQQVLFRPKPAQQETQRKSEMRSPQLTIFYSGKVLVFDNFPAERASELLAMAGSTPTVSQTPASLPDRSTCPPPQNAVPASTSANKPAGAVNGTTSTVVPPRPAQLPVASDLPIARRVSLNRFLEKRKGRINSKAPYQIEGSNDPASSSGATSDSSKLDDAAVAFPGFVKPKESSGKWTSSKPEEIVATEEAHGKPEPTFNFLAFGKQEEITVIAASALPKQPEERQLPWLGLATPSSSSLPEFDPKG